MAIAKPVLLESGDRLTRADFHTRYCAHPEIRKAELVEGVVYVASPVRVLHAGPHAAVIFWLNAYRMHHPGLHVSDNATVLLDDENEVQPDACLWFEATPGPRETADGYISGPPQLVVEIAASSASYDLHDKMRAYQRNGVLEYIVWRVLDEAIDWFRLEGGHYVRMEPDDGGVVQSAGFPGLRLSVPHVLADDLAGVLRVMSVPPQDR